MAQRENGDVDATVTVERRKNKGKLVTRLFGNTVFSSSVEKRKSSNFSFFFSSVKIVRRLSHAVFFGVNGSHSIFIILTSPSHAHVHRIKTPVHNVIFFASTSYELFLLTNFSKPPENFGQ